MKEFLEPESVAIIGVSRKSGPGSLNLMENMLEYGYKGKIFPVNPKAKEILGRKAYPNIKDIKANIDLAVISLPRELVLDSIRDCAEAGIKAVIVVGQGFADADEKGKVMQDEMVLIARSFGMRILGPNTLGVINSFAHFTTSFMPLNIEKSPVGLICQSGLFFVGAERFIGGIGKGIDIGNACDIGFYDCLKWLGDDPEIKLIVLHMEGIEQGRRFMRLASQIARKRPILVLKTGSSETGARAAISHSGSMAGDYQIYRAALRQAGIIVLDESQSMKDAVKTLLYLPLMEGNRVAVLTVTGAGGIIASDAIERYGLRVSELSRETQHNIKELFPEWMKIGNPIDLWPAVMNHGIKRAYPEVLKRVLQDPNVDGVLCIGVAMNLPEYEDLNISEELNQVVSKDNRKPVVIWLYGPNTEEIGRRVERYKQIMTYQSIERTAWALSLLTTPDFSSKTNKGLS